MAEKIDLKEFERKAWTSYHQDGFYDILFGGMIFLGGIRGITDVVWFTLLILVLPLIVFLGKKYITIPRLGMVKFGKKRKMKSRNLAVMLVISVAATMIIWLLSYTGVTFVTSLVSPIMAVWLMFVFAVLAHFLDFKRLYVYGLIIAVTEVINGLYGIPKGSIADIISGVVILVIGLSLLMKFMLKFLLNFMLNFMLNFIYSPFII